MKKILFALAAGLLMAAGTGCQTCGPCGSACDPCGDICGCGDACGSICGDNCGGNCGSCGGLLGELGAGGGIHPGGMAGGAIAGLRAPSPGAPRIAGSFNWHQRKETKHAMMAAEPGPPTAAYTYPYYTVRGPRDFFMDNPPPLGR